MLKRMPGNVFMVGKTHVLRIDIICLFLLSGKLVSKVSIKNWLMLDLYAAFNFDLIFFLFTAKLKNFIAQWRGN